MIQDVVLPEAYIDDRVVALKADARDLNMEELLSYAPKVRCVGAFLESELRLGIRRCIV